MATVETLRDSVDPLRYKKGSKDAPLKCYQPTIWLTVFLAVP